MHLMPISCSTSYFGVETSIPRSSLRDQTLINGGAQNFDNPSSRAPIVKAIIGNEMTERDRAKTYAPRAIPLANFVSLNKIICF